MLYNVSELRNITDKTFLPHLLHILWFYGIRAKLNKLIKSFYQIFQFTVGELNNFFNVGELNNFSDVKTCDKQKYAMSLVFLNFVINSTVIRKTNEDIS